MVLQSPPIYDITPERDNATPAWVDTVATLNDIGSPEYIGPEFQEEHSISDDEISKRIADVSSEKGPSPRKSSLAKRPKHRGQVGASAQPVSFFGSALSRLAVILVFAFAASTLVMYKTDSAWIGYCDEGRDSNLRIAELQGKRYLARQEAQACRIRYSTVNISSPMDTVNDQWNDPCNPIPFQGPFDATTCTPCPKRAVCTPDSVTCQSSFILRRHPLVQAFGPAGPLLEKVVNGLPLFGSVAFPPKCVEDRERLKRIGGLVKNIEMFLANTRGKRVCEGVMVPSEFPGGEAKTYGVVMDGLRESARTRSPVCLLISNRDRIRH